MKKYFETEEEAKNIYYYAHKHSSEIFVKEYIKPTVEPVNMKYLIIFCFFIIIFSVSIVYLIANFIY
jgi:hypothetical protein